MPSFRIRRKIEATGGMDMEGNIDIISGTLSASSGALTSGSLNVASGSTTINASGIGIGGGTKLTKMLFGTAVVAAPSFAATAGASTAGSPITVTGANIGNYAWVTSSSMPDGLTLVGGSPASNLINLKFESAACTAVAGCNLTIQYLVFAG